MCDPLSIATATIGVASAVTGFVGQSAQASAKEQYQNNLQIARNQQIAQNTTLAVQSYNQQSAQVGLNQQQQAAKNSQDIFNEQIQAMQAQAKAQVSAGGAGVSGLSLDSILSDYSRQNSAFDTSSNQNLLYAGLQNQNTLQGLQSQAVGRIQSIQPYVPQPVTQPSFIGAGLQIGSDVLGGFSQHMNQMARNRPGNQGQ